MPKRFPTVIRINRFTKKTGKIFWKLKFLIFFLIILIVGIVGMSIFVLKDIPRATMIGSRAYPQSSKIYDRRGNLLYTIYASKNQTFVPLDQIPLNLRNATVAIEDKEFYNHGSIDIRGIIRAAYSTLLKKQVQGGSTLTQQLVKTSLLTPNRTISRKIKEMILATVVEFMYPKNKILEMYLNQVPYGGTAWGAQAASYAYFGKPVEKLDLAESAFLAALPEAPSVYSPFGTDPIAGRERQKSVLLKMREQKYITRAQEEQALGEKLKFSKFSDRILAPHFVLYVKDLLEKKYGPRMVAEGGLNVTTSLDLSIQDFAQQAVASEVASLKNYNVSNGAALVTNPASGEILAMVGSRDYFDSARDGNVNLTTALRQPGSSIKPINYATGLVKGFTAASPFADKKTCFPSGAGAPYCPVNYDGKFRGIVQMRAALANSLNIPAVKMLKANGIDAMIATASAMGITTFTQPERYGLSLTLGGGEVRMTDMVEAFGVFANSGHKVNLAPILKITDSKGKVIEKYSPQNPIFAPQVIPDGAAFIISNILSDNSARSAAFGANSPLKINNYTVAVKTGTTNDYRDNWTIGYTPSYVVGVWVGNNNNAPMNGLVSGITGAAPIWHTIMANLINKKPPESFLKPSDIIGKIVCSDSGLLPPPDDAPNRCPTRFEYFIKGFDPVKVDPGMTKAFVDKTTQALAAPGQTDNVEEKDVRIITDITGDKYCVTCPVPSPSPTPKP